MPLTRIILVGSMCICVYVYMCICIYVYMYMCIYVYMCICVYVCICICICICMYVCMYVSMYVYTNHAQMLESVYLSPESNIYTHTHNINSTSHTFR